MAVFEPRQKVKEVVLRQYDRSPCSRAIHGIPERNDHGAQHCEPASTDHDVLLRMVRPLFFFFLNLSLFSTFLHPSCPSVERYSQLWHFNIRKLPHHQMQTMRNGHLTRDQPSSGTFSPFLKPDFFSSLNGSRRSAPSSTKPAPSTAAS